MSNGCGSRGRKKFHFLRGPNKKIFVNFRQSIKQHFVPVQIQIDLELFSGVVLELEKTSEIQPQILLSPKSLGVWTFFTTYRIILNVILKDT